MPPSDVTSSRLVSCRLMSDQMLVAGLEVTVVGVMPFTWIQPNSPVTCSLPVFSCCPHKASLAPLLPRVPSQLPPMPSRHLRRSS